MSAETAAIEDRAAAERAVVEAANNAFYDDGHANVRSVRPLWEAVRALRDAQAVAALPERIRRMDAVRALCEDAIERRQQYAERSGPSHAGLDAVALFAVDALALLDGDGEAGE